MSPVDHELLTYPLPPERWAGLISFWQTEWPRTDLDWLEALRGTYASSLTIRLATATCGGRIVGTASVYHPRVSPEVCCVADVLTSADMRGRGIAARLTETVVQAGFAAGCRAAYLGNAPKPKSVYEKIGFQRIRGAVMRRAAPGWPDPEAAWFTPGQPLAVRETAWADLPGFACLLAQPMASYFADYPRGLVSARHADPLRCVSNFTVIANEVAQRGGRMLTLAGGSPHRVLGFGSLTPEPGAGRAHRAVLEFAVHDHHGAGADLLIAALMAEARQRGLGAVQAYAVEPDEARAARLRAAGFRAVATLPDQVRLGGRTLAVSLWSTPPSGST